MRPAATPPALLPRRAFLAAATLFAVSVPPAMAASLNPVTRLTAYRDPAHQNVAAAGYAARTAQVNGVTLSYMEGPDDGPPLVLLHAQLLDWFSYGRVMPALAQSFHVFVVDYPGHGKKSGC